MEDKTIVGYVCNACGKVLSKCQETSRGVYTGNQPEECNECGSQDIELDIIPEGY